VKVKILKYFRYACTRLAGLLLAATSWSAQAQALPDLVATAVDRSQVRTQVKQQALSGDLTVTIKNTGAAYAAGAMNITAFYDSQLSGSFDASKDKPLGIGRANLSLAPGQSMQVSFGMYGRLPFRDAPISVFVDSFREIAEANESNNVLSSVNSTRTALDVRQATPAVKWHWPGSAAHPGFNFVNAMTTAGPLDDTNLDGKYDGNDESRVLAVAFPNSSYYTGGYLHVLNGKTGAELRSYPHLVKTGVTPAIADIDNDGIPDIVTIDQGGRLTALNRDLSLKWSSHVPLPLSIVNWGGVTVADIDSDGMPEIFWGNRVFNSNGALKWIAQTSNFGGHCCFHNDLVSAPIVTKLTASGPNVLLLGGAAFSANGGKLWENASVGDGLAAVGDLDKDGVAEIIIYTVSGNNIYALRPDGSVKWGPIALLQSFNPYSPPFIADIDGDSYPEVLLREMQLIESTGAGTRENMVAIRHDGVIKWRSVLDATNAVGGGGTAFDFDGNGAADPIVVTSDTFRVLSGDNGLTIFRAVAASFNTQPIVIDADSDNAADIIFGVGGWTGPLGTQPEGRGVWAYTNSQWAGTRKSWNQYAYAITNINDDMSVPRHMAANLNNYGINLPLLSPAPSTDISASRLRFRHRGCANTPAILGKNQDDDNDEKYGCKPEDHDNRDKIKPVWLTVRIGNAGSTTLPASVPVAVYGQTSTGTVWLGTARTSQALASGDYEDMKLEPRSLAGVVRYIVVADDDGSGAVTLNDVNRLNNRAAVKGQGSENSHSR
jgi:CARDB/FG-GAP-like repeat